MSALKFSKLLKDLYPGMTSVFFWFIDFTMSNLYINNSYVYYIKAHSSTKKMSLFVVHGGDKHYLALTELYHSSVN